MSSSKNIDKPTRGEYAGSFLKDTPVAYGTETPESMGIAAYVEALAASKTLIDSLAKAVLSIAEDACMPESFKEFDRRIILAKKALLGETA